MDALTVLKAILELRKLILAILVPILLIPVIYGIEGDAGRCAYATLMMAIFWILEVFPISMTSLLPVILFPALGIVPMKDVAEQYVKDPTFIVLGIFCIAAGVERWDLHRRIALRILLIFGTKPHWLILGLLVCNVFLSMWMSAGVAVMMLPIMKTLVSSLEEAEIPEEDLELTEVGEADIPKDHSGTDGPVQNGGEVKTTPVENAVDSTTAQENHELHKALSLAIAYGTSLGSAATLTGGPVNLVMQGLADELFRGYGLESGVTFGNWMVYALPMVVIITLLVWLWFVVLFLRCRGFCRKSKQQEAKTAAEERAMKHIRQEYAEMGPMSYPEIIILIDLIVLVLLYITQDLYFAPGWASAFKKGYVGSSAPTVLAALVLFVIPASSPREFIRTKKFVPIVTWDDVNKCVPWGVIWLLGGGFALVLASQKSGLSALIGSQFSVFADLDPWVMTVILTTITAFLTEFTSNAATITMLVPIVGQLAIQLQLHPMSLIFPLTMAGKFAFMTPIATPPNAIVFSMGALRVKDMAIAGFVVNIISLVVMNVGSQTWGRAYFGWDEFPEAMRINRTLSGVSGNVTNAFTA